MKNSPHYCSHGGVCELAAGHEGLHDTRYCQWSDDESVSREEADRILESKGPVGQIVSALWSVTSPRLDHLEDR